MKLSPFALGLALSSAVLMAPVSALDIRTFELQSAESGDDSGSERQTTRVKILQDGIELDEQFTQAELQDRDLLENRLGALPEEKRNKVINMLQRLGQSPMVLDFDFEPGLHREMIALTEEFHREHGDQIIALELKAEEMEQRASELQARAQEMAGRVEAQVDFITSGLDEEIMIDLGQDQQGKLVIIRDIDKPNMAEHIVQMLKHSKLSEQDRQAILDAVNQAEAR